MVTPSRQPVPGLDSLEGKELRNFANIQPEAALVQGTVDLLRHWR